MNTNGAKTSFSSTSLPGGVVHRTHGPTAMWKDPDRIQTTLRLHDGPSCVIQNDHVRAFGLERFGRDHEYTTADLGHGNLPCPFQSAHIALAQASIDGEERHTTEACGQLREESVLLLPGDRVGQTRRFRQHRDQWRQGVEPGTAVVISIGPSRAIQDRAHHLKAAIDRGGGYARSHPVRDKRFECAVMDSIHLKVSEIGVEQANVPSDQTNASLVLRLGKIARRAVRKPRMGSSLVLELRFDAGYFGIEALLSVRLTQRPESKANPYAAMFLVDGEITVGVDGNALRAGRSHDVPPPNVGCRSIVGRIKCWRKSKVGGGKFLEMKRNRDWSRVMSRRRRLESIPKVSNRPTLACSDFLAH